jgi:hypothetical protein
MKFKVTKYQFNLYHNKFINEVTRSSDYSEDTPIYNYKSINVIPNSEFNSKDFRVFFNSKYGQTEYKKPNEGNRVWFDGPNGLFEFDRDDIYVSKNNSPYIWSRDLTTVYYNIFHNLIDLPKTNIKQEITPYQIRKALKLAFPSDSDGSGKWNYENEIYSAGVRGVYTIGEKLGNDDDWSILNYFDTKKEVQNMINQIYSKSNSNLDIVDWLSNEFKKNSEFIETLVERQWKSIQNGYKSEELAKTLINGNNVIFYPSGSKMDRYEGVDATIDGVNYQIKPLISYSGKKEGPYYIKTYGMRDYKNKLLVDKILFVNPNKMLEFDNKNYSNTFDTAVFTDLPTKVTNVN